MLDACYLVYNEYANVFCQRPRVRQLLPIPPVELDPTERTDFCYEPSKESLLSQLLPMYLAIESHRAVLESVASESAARMVAMDAAHKNSVKLLEELTLRYHRERQHGITSELIERTSFLADSLASTGFSKWHRLVRDETREPPRLPASHSRPCRAVVVDLVSRHGDPAVTRLPPS